MIRKSIALAALACCPALPAHAADPLSSSYWEAQYLSSTFEATSGATTVDDDIEGLRAAISIGLMPYLNLVADYDQHRYAEAHDSFTSVGLGGHTLDPAWQVFGSVTYERAEYDLNQSSAGDHSEDGYGVTAGARVAIPFAEFHASYKYFDLSEVFPEIGTKGSKYVGGLTLDLTPWWSLVGDYGVRTLEYEGKTSTTDVEFAEWSVGLRRYLGTQSDPHNRTGGVFGFLFTGEESQ